MIFNILLAENSVCAVNSHTQQCASEWPWCEVIYQRPITDVQCIYIYMVRSQGWEKRGRVAIELHSARRILDVSSNKSRWLRYRCATHVCPYRRTYTTNKLIPLETPKVTHIEWFHYIAWMLLMAATRTDSLAHSAISREGETPALQVLPWVSFCWSCVISRGDIVKSSRSYQHLTKIICSWLVCVTRERYTFVFPSLQL